MIDTVVAIVLATLGTLGLAPYLRSVVIGTRTVADVPTSVPTLPRVAWVDHAEPPTTYADMAAQSGLYVVERTR